LYFLRRPVYDPTDYHSERSKGRLGRLDFPGEFRGGVPYPVEVKIPSARIVRLVAGGMFVNCFSDLPVLNTFVVGHSTLWILPEMFMFGVRLSALNVFNQRASKYFRNFEWRECGPAERGIRRIWKGCSYSVETFSPSEHPKH